MPDQDQPVQQPGQDIIQEQGQHGQRKPHAQRTKDEREKLSGEIARLRLQGLSFDQIGKQMSMAKQSAWTLYREYAKNFQHDHLSSQSHLLTEYLSRQEMVWRSHYAAYIASIPKNDAGQAMAGKVGNVKLLEAAAHLQHSMFDRLQSAGFIPKVKEKIEASINGEVRYPRPEVFFDEILRLSEQRRKTGKLADRTGHDSPNP